MFVIFMYIYVTTAQNLSAVFKLRNLSDYLKKFITNKIRK